MAQKIKVLLVDDHPLVCEWLTNLINQRPDFEICGQTGNAPEALRLVEAIMPDIAIVDISLASGSGIELIKNIKASQFDVVVLVLSMHDELLYAERALRAGAGGYVMKSEATQKIFQAIHNVLDGEIYVSEKFSALMTEKFVAGRSGKTISSVEQLSDRELEVFQLLGRGYNTRQIADHLHVGFKTIQGYSARIKVKLNLTTATQLLREAMRWHESRENSGAHA
jgi:DNA-binding NarL/FixJ family response regulator